MQGAPPFRVTWVAKGAGAQGFDRGRSYFQRCEKAWILVLRKRFLLRGASSEPAVARSPLVGERRPSDEDGTQCFVGEAERALGGLGLHPICLTIA